MQIFFSEVLSVTCRGGSDVQRCSKYGRKIFHLQIQRFRLAFRGSD